MSRFHGAKRGKKKDDAIFFPSFFRFFSRNQRLIFFLSSIFFCVPFPRYFHTNEREDGEIDDSDEGEGGRHEQRRMRETMNIKRQPNSDDEEVRQSPPRIRTENTGRHNGPTERYRVDGDVSVISIHSRQYQRRGRESGTPERWQQRLSDPQENEWAREERERRNHNHTVFNDRGGSWHSDEHRGGPRYDDRGYEGPWHGDDGRGEPRYDGRSYGGARQAFAREPPAAQSTMNNPARYNATGYHNSTLRGPTKVQKVTPFQPGSVPTEQYRKWMEWLGTFELALESAGERSQREKAVELMVQVGPEVFENRQNQGLDNTRTRPRHHCDGFSALQ